MGKIYRILPTVLGVAGRGMISRALTHTLTLITRKLRRALASVPKWFESACNVPTLPTRIMSWATFA